MSDKRFKELEKLVVEELLPRLKTLENQLGPIRTWIGEHTKEHEGADALFAEEAPVRPTRDEIEQATLLWEYETDTYDVGSIVDPPNSRPPVVVQRRRLVGMWEEWKPDDAGQATLP